MNSSTLAIVFRSKAGDYFAVVPGLNDISVKSLTLDGLLQDIEQEVNEYLMREPLTEEMALPHYIGNFLITTNSQAQMLRESYFVTEPEEETEEDSEDSDNLQECVDISEMADDNGEDTKVDVPFEELESWREKKKIIKMYLGFLKKVYDYRFTFDFFENDKSLLLRMKDIIDAQLDLSEHFEPHCRDAVRLCYGLDSGKRMGKQDINAKFGYGPGWATRRINKVINAFREDAFKRMISSTMPEFSKNFFMSR